MNIVPITKNAEWWRLSSLRHYQAHRLNPDDRMAMHRANHALAVHKSLLSE